MKADGGDGLLGQWRQRWEMAGVWEGDFLPTAENRPIPMRPDATGGTDPRQSHTAAFLPTDQG